MAVRLKQLTSAEEASGFLDVFSEIRIFEVGWMELNEGIKRLSCWHDLCFLLPGNVCMNRQPF
jgi:hypothetical protein